jgi:hypothetical protein
VHQSGSFSKDKKRIEKCYQSQSDKYMLASTMAQKQLNPPPEMPPKPIIMTPGVWPEGDSGSSKVNMPLLGETDSGKNETDGRKKNKRKQQCAEEIDVDINELRKMQGIRTDYKNLHQTELVKDPFEDEEKEEETSL